MTLNYRPELIIDFGDDYLITAKRPLVESEGKEKVIAQETAVMVDPLHMDILRAYKNLLQANSINDTFVLKTLGHLLYNILFPPKIHEALEAALKDVQAKKERLRLELTFSSGSAKLISMPWEFLWSPERKIFLATDTNLVLSRFHRVAEDERPTLNAGERPLKVLIMISQPEDNKDLITKDVVEAIRGLNSPVKTGQPQRVTVETVAQPSLKTLQSDLKKYKPHVFHFIGHGKYDENTETGSLSLVDQESKKSQECTETELIEAFTTAEVFPRLVFLHMCQGGVSEGDSTAVQSFSGFAPKLVHLNIPSVVAMQYPIKNSDARDFCIAFYGKLADYESVDAAVQEGRRQIDTKRQSRVFGTPVLYMHSSDGILQAPTVKGLTTRQTVNQPREVSSIGERTPDARQEGEPVAPMPVNRTVVDELLEVGEKTMEQYTGIELHTYVRKKLIHAGENLAQKSPNEMGKFLFDSWKNETEETVKHVWSAMMEAFDTRKS